MILQLVLRTAIYPGKPECSIPWINGSWSLYGDRLSLGFDDNWPPVKVD